MLHPLYSHLKKKIAMKKIIDYLFNRSKIVVRTEGKYAVAEFFDFYIIVWVKAYSTKEFSTSDQKLKPIIDLWVSQNPGTKIIDKRFEPNTYFG